MKERTDYSELQTYLEGVGGITVEYGVPLDKISSFKIGGVADCAVSPENTDELCSVLKFLINGDYKYLVIGNASNVLFSDEGYHGVIVFTGKCKAISFDGESVCAESGANLTSVCIEAQKRGLCGMEFAYGIPGSIGGAAFMNAGAYGGCFADVVTEAKFFDCKTLKTVTLNKDEQQLSYRTSRAMKENLIVLSVKLALNYGNADEIKQKMADILQMRRDKQPLEYPSAGSVFKRPEGYFAGKLIQDCDLRGYTVGGAQVSQKHAGFIINRGGAKASDVKAVICHCRDTVFEKFGVELECEIRFIEP